MNKLELLENEAYRSNIDVVNYHFLSERIKGLYCDGTIALSDKIPTQSEKSCILAEELGHYHTTVGDIVQQFSDADHKQEHRARVWAYNRLIGMQGIINSYKRGCSSLHDTADYLEVTEEFLSEALMYYKSRYGLFTVVDNYIIYFEPSLGVFELV